MNFYKSGEQKETNAQLTPATANSGSSASTAAPAESSPGTATQTQSSQTASPPDPMAPIPMGGYFVQVAAVTKKKDAETLMDTLKKKKKPAFLATNPSTSK